MLITDGDVAGVIHTAEPETGIDLYIGSGRRARGRAGLRGAEVRRRPVPGPAGVPQRRRARPRPAHRRHRLRPQVRPARAGLASDAIFAATGVTKGAMLDGVQMGDGFVTTHTLVMNSSTRTVRRIRTDAPALMADGAPASRSDAGVSRRLPLPVGPRLAATAGRGLGRSARHMPDAAACPSRWPAPWPRGASTADQGADFLEPTLKALFPDPSCFMDMDAAAEAIAGRRHGGRAAIRGLRRLRRRRRLQRGPAGPLVPGHGRRAADLCPRPAHRGLRPQRRGLPTA